MAREKWLTGIAAEIRNHTSYPLILRDKMVYSSRIHECYQL